jgi:RNA polymerase sigma factor (sigma-70 family)
MRDGINVEAALDMVPDIELLALIQAGDHQAFQEIYTRHFKAVAWIALRFLGTRDISEDAVQATFIVLWQKSKEIELADSSLMPWLATVCRLQCRNIQKKEWKRTHRSLEDLPHLHTGDRSLEDQAIDAALIRSLDGEISKMSAIDREIFQLCLVDGFSYDQAAESLGITHSALRNRLSRLKLKLRTFLA